jgi:hypothetical protein
MPLPNIAKQHAKQCSARTKSTGCRCQNLAAYGMDVCRVHGARKKHTFLSGGDHPNFVHGRETRKRRIARGQAMRRLRDLEAIGHMLGFIEGALIPGRKPVDPQRKKLLFDGD